MLGLIIIAGSVLALGGFVIYKDKKYEDLCKQLDGVNNENGKLAEHNLDCVSEIELLKKKIRALPVPEEDKILRIIKAESKKSKVDLLIDQISKEMKVTRIRCVSHSEEYDDHFKETKPLVILELNHNVELIELARLRDGSSKWSIDLLYKGSIFPRLTDEQRGRLEHIFMEKMAEAAAEGIEWQDDNRFVSEYYRLPKEKRRMKLLELMAEETPVHQLPLFAGE